MLFFYIFTVLLSAGIDGTDGERAGYWDTAAVLYAEVTEIHELGHSRYMIRLTPFATLTGGIDSATSASLTATATIASIQITVIPKVPENGRKVIVLLQPATAIPGVPLQHSQPREYTIPNGNIMFLPKNDRTDRPALFEVTGFDDPKVTETIENLRKLRGQQREEAEKDKAEQKPAAEKAAEKKSQPQNSAVK